MDFTPQVVTLKDVLISGRKIINEGKLQAQQENPAGGLESCLNACGPNNSIRCIVGSVLNDAVINRLTENDSIGLSVTGLIYGEYIIVKILAERQALVNLQMNHDSAVGGPDSYPEFLEYFETLEKEYGLTANSDA